MMELLNNIVVMFTTPNDTLINLIVIPAGFIESFICFTAFSWILNIQATLKQKIIYIVSCGIEGILTTYFLPVPINTLTNYILILIINYIVFRMTLLKTLLSVFIPVIILALLSTLLLNPFLTIFNIDYTAANTIPIYRIFFMTLLYSSTLLIAFIFKFKNLKINILDYFDKKSKYIILLNLLLGLLTLSMQLIVTIYYTDKLPIVITFLSFISLLAYFSISIYSLTRVMKLSITTQKLENAEEYNKTLHILHDSVRGFKHDFDNIVTTIGGYIKTKDIEGLEKYYTELVDDCQKVNNLYILNPEIINNPGIYNLLTNKYYEAESKGIKVNMTLLLDLNTLKMKIYEFARILGILLDNAIEASSECEEKIININFRNDQKNNRQLVIIENTYSNKDVDTSKIFGKGITGKENHTGLGLWEVQNILKKNNNIALFTSKTEKFFSQQLEIY